MASLNALGLHFLFGKVSFLAHSRDLGLSTEVFSLQMWVCVNRRGSCDLWDIGALTLLSSRCHLSL